MMIKCESGQTMLETSLIIAVFVLVVITSIPVLRANVAGVFQKTANTFNGETVTQVSNNPPVEEQIEPESIDPEAIDPENVQIIQKILGSEPGEISSNMLQLMNEYYEANKEWPTDVKWDPKTQSYPGSEEAWKTLFSWRYPELDINVAEFQKNSLSTGFVYTPNGDEALIESAPGYYMQFTGTNKETYSGSGIRIEMNKKDQKWYAYMIDEKGKEKHQEIDISSIKAVEGDSEKGKEKR